MIQKLIDSLRRETLMRHIEQHAPLGYGSDFEQCPNAQCQENARTIQEAGAIAAKLSERKTVHEWLDTKGVPKEEDGRKLCLLRRLAIALEVH